MLYTLISFLLPKPIPYFEPACKVNKVDSSGAVLKSDGIVMYTEDARAFVEWPSGSGFEDPARLVKIE